jgi:hypothetical protein
MNGVKNHILYITPKNVLIKSIETAQVPEFVVQLGTKSIVPCKIMIEDKFVASFVYICGSWYALMRLFGKTLNTGFLARTEKNKVFYKLTNIPIYLDVNHYDVKDTTINGNGLIILPSDKYTIVKNTSLIISTSKTDMVELKNECFENINKQNNPKVFNILQRFRQQKLFGNQNRY